MIISLYLKQYGKDKRRLLNWVSSNGGSTALALEILKDWAKKNKEFADAKLVDRTLMSLVHARQTSEQEVFHNNVGRLGFFGKLKWLLTRDR